MIDQAYIEQVGDLKVTERTEVKTYVHWTNTEEGYDPISVFERVGNLFVNVYNNSNIIIPGHPFYETLEELYFRGLKQKV